MLHRSYSKQTCTQVPLIVEHNDRGKRCGSSKPMRSDACFHQLCEHKTERKYTISKAR